MMFQSIMQKKKHHVSNIIYYAYLSLKQLQLFLVRTRTSFKISTVKLRSNNCINNGNNPIFSMWSLPSLIAEKENSKVHEYCFCVQNRTRKAKIYSYDFFFWKGKSEQYSIYSTLYVYSDCLHSN